MTELDRSLLDALPAHLALQRWYAGTGAPSAVEVMRADWLGEEGSVLRLLVRADGAMYQLVLGRHEPSSPPALLHGHEAAVLPGGWHDAMVDPGSATVLLRAATGEGAARARPLGVEQSNSSAVFDERLILKLFRRLHEGPNPDIEVTGALLAAGFQNVATIRGVLRDEPYDLALVQDFLLGGSEGWALALTSVRDLLAEGPDDPAQAGGDFAGEAGRLGEVTGRLHLALARSLEREPGDGAAWAATAEAQLEAAGVDGRAHAIVERLRAVTSAAGAGAAIRTHGDFHLGQVMRTDDGWFVVDFEGEPGRPLADRRRLTSPLRDVAGMLRSLQYAAEVGRRERGDDLVGVSGAWEQRNRQAYLRAYLSTDGIADLLPPTAEGTDAALVAFELEKAAYELAYERAFRPDWASIPESAIGRLLAGGA